MENLRAPLHRGPKPQSGFSLVELLVVIAIVAILASIAIPGYQEHVRKGHRAAAQTEMMDIANRQQQFFLANRRYATTLAELSYALPADVDARYAAAVAANNAATPPTFTITFTAESAQVADGTLTLDNTGAKTPAAKW